MHFTIQRQSKRLRVRMTAGVLAAIALLIGVSGAWALIGGGTPPATFSVTLDGEPVTTAKGYELDGALASGKREYTLRLSLALTDNASPVQAFQSGQTFASAEVMLIASNFAILRTYTLTNATVIAYRQSGDASTNAFEQELVLRSKSLSVG